MEEAGISDVPSNTMCSTKCDMPEPAYEDSEDIPAPKVILAVTTG